MEKLKKLFAAAAAVVLSFGAFAEMTAKVVVQDGGKTLRFVYDETDYGKKGTDWYSVAEGEVDDGRWDVKDVMPWCEIKRNITKVIFDPSFKDYRPSSCYQWFLNCSRLKSFEGLTNLDTSEATNLGCMFMGCSKLMTLDLSHLNTSRVHNFSFMFAACTSLFRVDVSGFDTRVGQFMEKMFFMCRKLQTLNLSSFNTQYVVFMEEMFSGCSELETIVVSELFAICTLWTNDNGIDMFRDCEMLVGGNGNKYSAMQTDATYACIDSNFGRGYFTGIVSPKVVYDREAGLLKFVYDDKGYGKKDVDWFSVREAEERAKSGKLPVWIHKAYMSVRKVVIDGTFSHYRPKSCYAWFHLLQLTKGLENLRCLDTSEVTDMRFMFNMCIVWTDLDFSQFKTSKVVDMASMFDRFTYEGAKLDLSSFNTSNVTNMNGLFRKATVRRIDCASFNTTAVTDMTEMFRDNSKLQVIYGPDSFSTSALKPGCDQDMFTGCKNLASVGGIGTKYSDGHTDSTYARVDDDGTPGYFSAKMISVTFEGNGGLFKETGTAKLIRKYQMGKGIDSFPEPIRSGYQLISWRTYQSGVDSDHLTKDVTYQAQWLSDEEVAERNSASSQDPNVPCAVIHFHAMDGIFEDYDTDELCYKYPLGLSYDWLPTPTANTAGQQLYCWFDLDAGEIVEADDIVTESRTLYACYYTPKVKTVYFYDLEFQQSPCYEVEVGCSAYLPAPRTKTGYTFAGWFSEENGGGKKFVNGKAPTSSDTAFYAYWQKNAEPDAPEPVVWTQNRYGCAELSTLGVDLPADVSTVKKVTIEGAVKDLKLVQDKAKTKWYLEGVPKETLDGKTRTMAARIAFKEKGKADSVQTLLLSIVADKHTTAQMNLNAVYVKDAAELFGVDAFDANWDVTGLAANLKYAKKATTWKDSSKTSHDIPAYAIYGQPNKLCAMTLVGKRKVTSEVPDSKTTHVELYSAEVLVRPESGMYDRMVKLNAQEEALYDVAADYGWATDTKTKASTPPSGLKFTNKETKSGKTTVPAGSFYGKPTKTGYFPVTLTGPNKETANYLVWIVNPEAPDVGCYFGSASKKLAKKVKAGGSAEEQTQKLELMVGASFDFPLIVTEGATVKQSGLPTGLKLAQDKTTKRWTIAGVPTKAGTYYATVTATKNGAATTVMTIWADSDRIEWTNQAYTEVVKEIGFLCSGATPLPTGLKFTNKAITDKTLGDIPAYSIYGVPTKPGVFAVTFKRLDKSTKTILWRITEGKNDGFLGTMDWKVEDSAVTVMQGVIQDAWTCKLPADAKVTASTLPTGLKLALNKEKTAWVLSGTPTKEGNYVTTFKTVMNGVTVTERLSFVIEPNEWTGTWYGVQYDEQDASLMAEVTVSANGTVKLVYTEGTTNYNAKGVLQSQVTKTTVTVKNLDANGTTATLVLPKDKKDPLSVDRTCVIDFDRNRIKVDGVRVMSLHEKVTTDEFDVGYWSDVTTIVAEEVLGAETNAYAYVTVTFDAKKHSFKLQGKLWDGTAINATASMIPSDAGPATSPILVIDKMKNAVMMMFASDDRGHLCASIVENGKGVSIGRWGFEPWFGQFLASQLKSKKFNQLTEHEQLVILDPDSVDALVSSASGKEVTSKIDAVGTTASTEIVLDIPQKSLTTAVSAQGLVKFTITDADGWKWVCELLPVGEGGDGPVPFCGIATGTKAKQLTRYCPVWTK